MSACTNPSHRTQGRTPPPVIRATRSQLRNVHIRRSRGACAPSRGPHQTINHRAVSDPGSHHSRPHGRPRRSRSRPDRIGQNPRLRSSIDRAGGQGQGPSAPGSGPGTDAGTGRANRTGAGAFRQSQRPGGSRRLRRGGIRTTAQRAPQGRRRARSHSRTAGRSDRRGHRVSRGYRPGGDRRGRPYGRHGLHAAGPPVARPDQPGPADDAVFGDPR